MNDPHEHQHEHADTLEEHELERLLRASAPRVSEPYGFEDRSEGMIAELGLPPEKRIVHRTLLGLGLVTLMVLGGGSVFASVGGFEPLGGGDEWKPDAVVHVAEEENGLCELGYRIEDNVAVPYEGDRQVLLEAARSTLMLMDLEAVDAKPIEQELRSLYADAANDASEALPDPLIQSQAHLIATAEAIRASLIEQGFDDLPDPGEDLPYGLHGIGEECE